MLYLRLNLSAKLTQCGDISINGIIYLHLFTENINSELYNNIVKNSLKWKEL